MTYKNKAVKTFFCAVVFSVCVYGAAGAINVSAATVTASSTLNLRSGPSASSSVLASIPSGAKILVYSENSEWSYVSYSGQVGYASRDYLSIMKNMEADFGKGCITGSTVNLRADSSTGSAILKSLSRGTSVSIIGLKNDWYKVTSDGVTGYVSSDYLTTATAAATAKDSSASELSTDVVAYAKKFLGVRYVSGGESPNGFDCSGFTWYVFKNFGVSLSRSSGTQYSSNCTKISKSELSPGDLVFFSNPNRSSSSVGHVGIYIGGNSFIHASSPGDVVKITSLSDSYYLRYYIGSGRVLT